MKLQALLVALTLSWFGAASSAAPAAPATTTAIDTALEQAVSNPLRTPANVARDVWRHPAQTLNFFGIQPAMTVVEISPGGGWYSEILAAYLRDKGRLILAASDPASTQEAQRNAAARLRQRLDAKPALFDKVQHGVFAPPNTFNYAAASSVDMVLTFRNVHNWAADGDDVVKAVFKSAFDALKAGGVMGVVDHRLPASRAQDAKASTGYLQIDYVVRLAQSAGFKLVAQSEVNANPKDTADHENGVWALPPTFANKDKDRAQYAAIGESDRMTLKFMKPN